MSLTPRERERYRRHLVLRELGEVGQERLRQAAVSLQGHGKAAEEAAFYLVAAGVGRILLEDALASRIRERLSELNPEVRFVESAIAPHVVNPQEPERRASGALAALQAIMALAAIPFKQDLKL